MTKTTLVVFAWKEKRTGKVLTTNRKYVNFQDALGVYPIRQNRAPLRVTVEAIDVDNIKKLASEHGMTAVPACECE